MNLKRQWLLCSVAALITIGLGVSVIGEAIRLRTLDLEGWFLWGTLGLILFNSGLSLLGQAVYLKVQLKLKK